MSIYKSSTPDPFGLSTDSMRLFIAGQTDWYTSRDGFHHQLSGEKTRMTIKCLACGENKSYAYSEVQTKENELIAAEAAHWQMGHREKCKVPTSTVKIK